MGPPIPNRFTQTLGLSQSNKDYTNPQILGFPSPIRIIQTYKQIVF